MQEIKAEWRRRWNADQLKMINDDRKKGRAKLFGKAG
jgi:hypothetical protein